MAPLRNLTVFFSIFNYLFFWYLCNLLHFLRHCASFRFQNIGVLLLSHSFYLLLLLRCTFFLHLYPVQYWFIAVLTGCKKNNGNKFVGVASAYGKLITFGKSCNTRTRRETNCSLRRNCLHLFTFASFHTTLHNKWKFIMTTLWQQRKKSELNIRKMWHMQIV